MKVIQILGDKSSPTVTINDSYPRPVPKDDEILVKVHAAGITGDEITWPEVYSSSSRIPGHEISGTIEAFGPHYKGILSLNQQVFALLQADGGYGQAEYVTCSPSEVAVKPVSFSHDAAAAIPIPALTAWEGLHDHGQLKQGMTVLITGASGAVGIQALQLASLVTDVKIVALASQKHHATLKALGADHTLDYNDSEWHAGLSVDLVFDTVGGKILDQAWRVVHDTGTIVTVGDPAPAWAFDRCKAKEAAAFPGVRYVYFIVSPDSGRLTEISRMLDEGKLQSIGIRSFEFDEAVAAWAYARQRGRGEKAVLRILNTA